VAPGSGLIWFATQDGFGSVDPVSGSVQVVATSPQKPRRMAAAPDGTLWLTDGTPYVTQFTPPASFARLREFVDDDARSAGLFIDPSGVVYVSNEWEPQLAKIAVAQDTQPDAIVTEFYNALLDHYFVTADAAEAAAIDAGSAGPGWIRTGQTWKGWTGGPIPNATPVCRFYGSPEGDPATGARRGPNSHFYTVQPAECAAVRLDSGWKYESASTHWMVRPGADGVPGCPGWTLPVYRAYNNGFARNDSNHRYMTSAAVYAQMVAQGWSGEGAVMCAPM
jgi:hypothetical protein